MTPILKIYDCGYTDVVGMIVTIRESQYSEPRESTRDGGWYLTKGHFNLYMKAGCSPHQAFRIGGRYKVIGHEPCRNSRDFSGRLAVLQDVTRIVLPEGI